MTEEVQHSREIDGKGRTVRELLANRKYSIDYYQREYKWQTKQLSELMALPNDAREDSRSSRSGGMLGMVERHGVRSGVWNADPCSRPCSALE
jgi:hypothetical protein